MTRRDNLCLQIERRVSDFVAARALLRSGQRALLMLSGGADSMALFSLMRICAQRLDLDLAFEALHVDYATRGADSDRDREIVSAACAAHDVRLQVVRLTEKLRGGNFQERARELRYRAAGAVADERALDVIVTAHNRDDQAETVLYRLAKYAAPLSAAGMRVSEGRIVRPLLCVGAAEVREYCRRAGIVYGEDVSNASPVYARNRIRLEVLPALATINPRAAETIADAAEIAALEGEVVAGALDAAWQRVARPNESDSEMAAAAELDTVALAAEPAALRVLCLRRLLRVAYGPGALIERRVVAALAALAAGSSGSAGVSLPHGYEAVREYRRLSVRPRAGAHACLPLALGGAAEPGVLPLVGDVAGAGLMPVLGGPAVAVDFCGRRFRLRLLSGAQRGSDDREATIGLSGPPRGLLLRHPRRGDRFAPLGMATPTTVAAFVKNACVPAADRPRTVVVEIAGAVAWVAPAGGRPARVAETFRVDDSTGCTLHISEEGL